MLYQVNKRKIETSLRIPMVTTTDVGILEKDIENLLASRISEVVSLDHLMLIAQERYFQPEADLMALDREGRLYIFELKRGPSNPRDILQVLKYGQVFGQYTYDELEELVRNRLGIEHHLQTLHQKYFGLSEPLQESEFNHKQVFVLITNGADLETYSAVDYWKNRGLDIKVSPYRVYKIDRKSYIQFETYNPEGDITFEGDLQHYILNTCEKHRPGSWKEMIGGKKAAAYGGRKIAISNKLAKEKAVKEKTVYLYQNKVGVIAKGIAKSNYRVKDCDGDKNEEYYVPLEFKWVVIQEDWGDKAVKARQINEKRRVAFINTITSIPQEVADIIDEIAEDNGIEMR